MQRSIKFRLRVGNKFAYWGFIDEAFYGIPSQNIEPMTIDEMEKRSQQFTGLKDKNAKEIYEGDILVVRHLHDGHEDYWNQPTGPAIPIEVQWIDIGWDMPRDTQNFEIIGNIYENPELNLDQR